MNLDERLQKDLSPDIYCLVHNKIVNLEQQCKKQKDVIDKTMDIINDYLKEDYSIYTENEIEVDLIVKLKNILNEVSE